MLTDLTLGKSLELKMAPPQALIVYNQKCKNNEFLSLQQRLFKRTCQKECLTSETDSLNRLLMSKNYLLFVWFCQ